MKTLPVLRLRSPLFLLSLIVILASVHPKFPVYAATQSVSITDIHQTQAAKTPILVEFFTSDKCPACNSVESFLTHLDRDQHADIILFKEQVHPRDIPLEQHPTSAFSLTERQKDYQEYFKLTDSPTPQIIVNGAEQFTESDHSAIAASVKQAASADTYPLQFANVRVRGRNIEFSLQQAPATHREYVNVYAVLLGPSDSTKVLTFGRIGSSWHMKDLNRHPEQPFLLSSKTPLGSDAVRLVVFTQVKHMGPVLAIGSCWLNSKAAVRESLSSAMPCPSLAVTPE